MNRRRQTLAESPRLRRGSANGLLLHRGEFRLFRSITAPKLIRIGHGAVGSRLLMFWQVQLVGWGLFLAPST